MWLTLCTLNIFETFVIICWLLIEINFFKNSYRNTIRVSNSCADPGNFVRGGGGGGGPGQSDKRALTSFFFVLSFFLQQSNGQFQRNLSFFRVTDGVQHFPGGSNYFQWGGGGGGVQLLISYRNPYNLWFSRGVRTPFPPLWIRTWNGLYPDQNWHSVGTELGPNYLQMLSSDKVRE